MAPDSHVLWRRYLDFVQEWPEQGVLDSGRKLSVLREVYQRAVCIPMEDLERFWQEYEELEMRAGEHLATQLLPEFKPKNQHARSVFRDRKKIIGKIQRDRVATPPSSEGSVAEMEQLELWNKWVGFEMGNPDNLAEDKLRSMLRMVFDMCLGCFYLHPEVWISLYRYVLSTAGPADARAVLKDALAVIPQVPTPWFVMAEFEEQHGSLAAAVGVLRTAFETVPCAFTFAALQRLIRRKDGKIAARKLFSETKGLRSDNTLGYEVYVAHALLEVEVNNEPQVALRVLEMAKSLHPVASNNPPFLKLMAKVLVRLGDVKQLRWLFQTALGSAGSVEGGAITGGMRRHKYEDGFSQEEQLELW
ncbi:CSTF77, partial [Symbiodinium microadriaticum]